MADRAPTLRRAADSLLPFFVGLIIGFTSTFAAFSSRLATLEANSHSQADEISELKTSLSELQRTMSDINVKVTALAQSRGVTSRDNTP